MNATLANAAALLLATGLLVIVPGQENAPTNLEPLAGNASKATSLSPAGIKDLAALVQGNNDFAFDLYARLAKSEGNIVFSPYSISNALAMTYAGARGQTAEEMAKVLHFTLGQDRLHPTFAKLIGDLQKDDKARPYHLDVANSLWGQKGYPFVPDFLQLTHRSYRAGLNEVDFAGDPEQARKTINHWVEERTKDKIKELLLRDDVSRSTRLVLTQRHIFQGHLEDSVCQGADERGHFRGDC